MLLSVDKTAVVEEQQETEDQGLSVCLSVCVTLSNPQGGSCVTLECCDTSPEVTQNTLIIGIH